MMPLIKCESGKDRWDKHIALLTEVCPYCVHPLSLLVDAGIQKSPSNDVQKLRVSGKSEQ